MESDTSEKLTMMDKSSLPKTQPVVKIAKIGVSVSTIEDFAMGRSRKSQLMIMRRHETTASAFYDVSGGLSVLRYFPMSW